MVQQTHSLGLLFGRGLLSSIFLVSAVMKIMNWLGTADYMASHGMPAVPQFLFAAMVVELAGGAALLLGVRARLTALLLACYLVPVTLIFHAFWNEGSDQRQNQMFHFLKNVAITGGLLTVAGAGPGRFICSRARQAPFELSHNTDAAKRI